MLMQLNFKVSKDLVDLMDECIDDVGFRSRGQILNIALAEWLARRACTPPQGIPSLPEGHPMMKTAIDQAAREYERVSNDDPMDEEVREQFKSEMRKALQIGAKEQLQRNMNRWVLLREYNPHPMPQPIPQPIPQPMLKLDPQILWTAITDMRGELVALRSELDEIKQEKTGGTDKRGKSRKGKTPEPEASG